MAWLHVHFNSQVLRMPISMEVLLPQHISGGKGKVESPGPYQTLYLLHDLGEDHTTWLRKSSVERYIEGLPIAVVLVPNHLGAYTDMAYGRNYFKFITEELPAFCERNFPLSPLREDRFIAGNAIGGYGAVKASLLSPKAFATAAAFSSEMDVTKIFYNMDNELASDIFGSRESLKGSKNDLFFATEEFAKTKSKNFNIKLYLRCNKTSSSYASTVTFKEKVLEIGIPLTYQEDCLEDSWHYWDKCINDLIKWLPIRK